MKQYTIYCTDKQVKKALELGAPLDWVWKQDGTKPIYYTLPASDPKWMDCDAYYMPTAEQMIGWLEEEINIIEIGANTCWWCYTISDNNCIVEQGIEYQTRKEATLAAIDAALDFLSVKKTVAIIEKEAKETNHTNLLSGLNEYGHFKVCFRFSDGCTTFPNIRSFGNFYIFGETQKNVIILANELDYGSVTETTCGELSDMLSKHQAQNLILAFRCNEYGKIRMFTNIRCCDIGHSDKVYVLTGEEVEENTKL